MIEMEASFILGSGRKRAKHIKKNCWYAIVAPSLPVTVS